jgi:hypothetical protein
LLWPWIVFAVFGDLLIAIAKLTRSRAEVYGIVIAVYGIVIDVDKVRKSFPGSQLHEGSLLSACQK